ncbi:MAG: pilus assembly protein [Atopobiaceae bacterium]|nr:pilus assembly protein [Atopobiaceae bacterium]
MLPIFMLLLAMLLQPVCLLYTRSVMESAAAEGLRVLTTAQSSESSTHAACERYVLRRLDWIPKLPLFHVGGSADWAIELEGGQTENHARISISGHVRQLPLMNAVLSSWIAHDDRGLVLSVEVQREVRPQWLEGDYASWQKVWA